MSSDESSGSESGVPGGGRRRPPSTIELQATEVASEPAAAPGHGSPSEPETEPPAAADREPAPGGGGDRGGGNRRGGAWGLLGGGVAGGVVAALVLGGLWGFGLLAPRNDESNTEWTALAAKVVGLERQVQEMAARPQPGADTKQFETIDARLQKLEAAAATPTKPASDPVLAERLTELDRRIEQAIAAAHEARGRADAAANQAQKADAQSAANPAERSDLEALAARFGKLEEQVKADEQRLGKVAAGTDRTVRFALVALELRVAVEHGAPFQGALAAARQLSPDTSALAPLEAVADKGVPTPAALAQNLSKIAPAMLSAANAPRREAGVMERLQASAERLVRIRPIEEAPGDEPTTVVARAELKATRGDIAGAVADLDRLPEPVRAPAHGWIEAAKARIAAVDAAKNLAANALEALARPSE